MLVFAWKRGRGKVRGPGKQKSPSGFRGGFSPLGSADKVPKSWRNITNLKTW